MPDFIVVEAGLTFFLDGTAEGLFFVFRHPATFLRVCLPCYIPLITGKFSHLTGDTGNLSNASRIVLLTSSGTSENICGGVCLPLAKSP